MRLLGFEILPEVEDRERRNGAGWGWSAGEVESGVVGVRVGVSGRTLG